MGVPSRDLTPVIQTLWPHHRSMARDMIMGGLTPTQLAVLYGFSQSHTTRIINSPCFRLELDRLEGKAEAVSVSVRKELKAMAAVANGILDAQLQVHREMDRKEQRDLCFGILDRAGYSKGDRGPKGLSAGRDVHLTQVNVGELSDKDLRDNVMDLIDGEWSDAESN